MDAIFSDHCDGVDPQALPTKIITPVPELDSEQTAFAKKSWQMSSSSSYLDKIVFPTQAQVDPEIRTVAIKPEPTTVFTSYDVLLAPSSSSPSSNRKDLEYTLINHVGNRRFLVLLRIYRQRYIEADEQGDQVECLRIMFDIIKTIRQQCQPNGRFFQFQQVTGRNQWFEIDELTTLIRIVRDQLTKNVSSSADADGERAVKRARTATAETCCQVVAKMTFPHELSRVDKPMPFDVICNSNWLSLQANSNHVGNNRLQVILDMRQAQFFEASTREERNIIVNGIVSAIIDDSASQFLSLHASSGSYTQLSREAAAMCVENALHSKSATLIPHVQKSHSSEASRLLSRHRNKRVIDGVERRHNDLMNKISIPGISNMNRVTYNPRAA